MRILLITLVGLSILLSVATARSSAAQDDGTLNFRTRAVPNGRIDLDEGVWRAKYRFKPRQRRVSVRETLRRESAAFGWTPELRDLRLIKEIRSGRTRHLTYQQTFLGIPVHQRVVRISLNNRDEPTMIVSGFAPTKKWISIDTSPRLSREGARDAARRSAGTTGGIVSDPELVIYPGDGPLLAWRVFVWPADQPSELEILLDARKGTLLSMNDRALRLRELDPVSPESVAGNGSKLVRWDILQNVREDVPPRPTPDTGTTTGLRLSNVRTAGSGYVFDPDPITRAGADYAPPYVDNDNATNPELDAARSLVTLNDISVDNDGLFVLTGPFVDIIGVNNGGTVTYTPPREISPSDFVYARDNDFFEGVNAYYHIDLSQRYLQSLGFLDRQNEPFRINPHGLDRDDSFFFPNQKLILFGSGGVDDAEDASVLWHEYGHALLEAGAPGLLNTVEGAALHEGWSDYWAASYARYLTDMGLVVRTDWNRMFRWDSGLGAIWPGRVLDFVGHYPEDTCSDDSPPVACSVHNDGRLWATVMLEIYTELGREITDRLNLLSHSYLSSPVTFRDAAEAVVQADIDEYGGVHTGVLTARLGARGLLASQTIGPFITHDPLSRIETPGGTATLEVEVIAGSFPVQTVTVHYENSIGVTAELILTPSSGATYTGELPIPSSADTLSYYIVAEDTGNQTSFLPADAPVETFEVIVGSDTVPPILQHESVLSLPLAAWPPIVEADATDDLGIRRVFVTYRIENLTGMVLADGSFDLASEGNDHFASAFPVDASVLEANTEVSYSVTAVDASVAENETRLPDSGEFAFFVSANGLLRQFDFESDIATITSGGEWSRGIPDFGVQIAHSGDNAFATNLVGPYASTAGLSTLELPAVNLKGVADAFLLFWHWYDTENDGTADPATSEAGLWDGGNVKVSIDEGLSWQILTPETGYRGLIDNSLSNPLGGEPGFGGFSFGWRQEIIPLPSESAVRIRFDFGTDAANTQSARWYAGWVIDDVSITTVRPADSGAPSTPTSFPSFAVLSTEDSRPGISFSLSDDNGIADAFVDFTYQTGSGNETGSFRLAQSATSPVLYEGTFDAVTDPLPGDQLRFSVRANDFSGNETVFSAAPGVQFEWAYRLIETRDLLAGVLTSGVWKPDVSGWTTAHVEPEFDRSSLNLAVLDLSSNADDASFILAHRYFLKRDLGGNVKISDDDGESWSVLEPASGYPGVIDVPRDHPMEDERGFEGQQLAVRVDTFNLSPWSGRQVKLRIDLATPRALSSNEGWTIESIRFIRDTADRSFEIPLKLALHQNYPNPFRTRTRIGFTLEKPGRVVLEMYDIMGRRVSLIEDRVFNAGSWESTVSAGNLSGGMYIIRLRTDGRTASRVVTIVR